MLSSNEQKHTSSNPIKKVLLKNFHELVLDQIELISPKSILDVGCGEGYVLEMVADIWPEIKLFGVDPSAQAIEQAKKKVPSADFKVKSIFDINPKEYQADLIISLEVFEHIPNYIEAMTHFRKLVKKQAIVSVPNEPTFSFLSLITGSHIKRWGRHPEHVNFWNELAFEKFLQSEFAKVSIRKSLPWLIAKVE